MSNSLSISTAAYDGHNLAVALEEISSLRVNFVELAFIQGYTDPFTEDYFNKTNAGEIRRLLEHNGVDCRSFSAHMDLTASRAVDVFKKRMDFARMVGAEIVISNAGPREREAEFLKNMEELIRHAASLGITIGLENPGDGRPSLLDCGRDAEGLIERLGFEAVGINYDFGNLVSHLFEKVRPEEDYRHVLPWTVSYHIKDVAPDVGGWHFTEIGQGAIDYGAILKELTAQPVPKPLSLEIPLRLSRARDASARRSGEPVDLKVIHQVLAGSLAFVRRAIES